MFDSFCQAEQNCIFSFGLIFTLPDGTKKEKEDMNHSLIIFIVSAATAYLLHLD